MVNKINCIPDYIDTTIKEDKAQQSNLSVAVTFDLEREAVFEHTTTKTIVWIKAGYLSLLGVGWINKNLEPRDQD